MGATIIGCGKAIPALDIPNDDLAALVDTSDEWIRTRTGIESRRIAINETTHTLAIAAACRALGMDVQKFIPDDQNIESIHALGDYIDPESIDLLIFPTITSDTIVPSAAAALKKALGLKNAVAFDINAACSGFIYGMCIAETMMAASNMKVPDGVVRNKVKRALIVCSERLTRITNWKERGTCVLFGDGAGAAVVEWREDEPGIIATYIKNDDDTTNALSCPNSFTSPLPFSSVGVDINADIDPSQALTDASLEISDDIPDEAIRQVIRMDGQTIFKFASKTMCNAVNHVVSEAGLTLDDIKLIVPHQANERIIAYAAKRLGLPIERFQVSIAHTGNTSSSGEPMALADAFATGKISRGDKIVLVAFGGGLTSGSILLQV